MDIILSNSLTHSKEIFTPFSANNVKLYACGPTVYDFAHIGNARAIVAFDVLFRVLRHNYGTKQVTYVRNITDVDDKINQRAKEQNIAISELTNKTTKIFHADMAALNCLAPTIEPKATEHITEMLAMIKTLIEGGFAYVAENHVLFKVKAAANYGNLSRRSQDEMIAGARIEVAPYKQDPMDFVLWKPSKEDEPGWDSPYGRGRPGWHIECSAMSTKYLGSDFDIHAGGADLTFPHHENEIVQSTCAYKGSNFAKYWVHNGFLSVNGEKMSKSLGNFITVHELLDKGVKGEVIRYALLSTHYKKPLDWNEKLVKDATITLDKFYKILESTTDDLPLVSAEPGHEILKALYDDLNTPLYLSLLHKKAEMIKKAGSSQEKADLLASFKAEANLMGLLTADPKTWFKPSLAATAKISEAEINQKIAARSQAKSDKNWAEADKIRNELLQLGVALKDQPGGIVAWHYK